MASLYGKDGKFKITEENNHREKSAGATEKVVLDILQLLIRNLAIMDNIDMKCLPGTWR